MQLRSWKHALVIAGFGAFSSVSSAALIGTFEGNDCAGVYGSSFPECRIPANIDPNQTPVIIKFEFGANGFTATDINTALFPSIDGSEFSFTPDGTEARTGEWRYTPGADDPAINYFVAKGGTFFNLFSNDGDPNVDTWLTPFNSNSGQPFGLSHLTFYDTRLPPGQVPEPTTLLLLGAGLLGIGMVRRRRRA